MKTSFWFISIMTAIFLSYYVAYKVSRDEYSRGYNQCISEMKDLGVKQ